MFVVFYQNVFTPIQPPVIKRQFFTNQSIPIQTDIHWLPWKYGARSCLHFDIMKMQQNTLVIPFIPNLLRLLYLLMRTKITMRKTQPKPARPTAIDIYRKKALKQSIEFKEELQPFDFLDRKNILLQMNLLQDSSPHLQVLELQEIEKSLLN